MNELQQKIEQRIDEKLANSCFTREYLTKDEMESLYEEARLEIEEGVTLLTDGVLFNVPPYRKKP